MRTVCVKVLKQLMFGIFLASLSTGAILRTAYADTYHDLLKHAAGDGKSAQTKGDDESPVMVTYEVGDTAGFLTKPGGEASSVETEESDDWVAWEDENK